MIFRLNVRPRLLSAVAILLNLVVIAGSAGPLRAEVSGISPQRARDIDEAVERFERYVFPPGEDVVTGMVERKTVQFGLLGYVGGVSGFTDLMFSTELLHPIGNMAFLIFQAQARNMDVALFISDTPLSDGRAGSILNMMGSQFTQGMSRKNVELFNGACSAANIYGQDGSLFKTIVSLNVGHTDISTNRSRSLVPGACLAAAAYLHVGLRNVAALSPDEVLLVSPATGIRAISRFLLAAQDQLYNAGISNGMSRAEAKKKVREYLVRLVKQEQRKNDR